MTRLAPPRSFVLEAEHMADARCADLGLDIREVHAPEDLHTVSQVLSRIWRTPGTPIIDHAVLTAMTHAGNPVFLARHGTEAVGAAVGFCGPAGSPFHSHIVGFLPDSAGRGFGHAIKLRQRAWCLENGIVEMTWTYDPLVCRNAHFNISRLGAVPIDYLPDFYGQMTDSINAGELSDRMLILWDLTCDPTARSWETGDDATPAVEDRGGAPTPYAPPVVGTDSLGVAVPWDIEALRREDPVGAHTWRLATREAFTDLLGNGWRITGFSRRSPHHGQYVLRRP
ncbi:hypothetical protein [Brevibacterium sediminis]|uniref:hypothetical protein n=1 Tax=Brevibacterium sediminis TaxID=1857024 RepID=UPI003B3AF513